VPSLEWNGIIAAARASRAADANELVEILRALQPLLERYLPRLEGDRDELSNAPRFEIE
jgi:uncharacterized membrane protein